MIQHLSSRSSHSLRATLKRKTFPTIRKYFFSTFHWFSILFLPFIDDAVPIGDDRVVLVAQILRRAHAVRLVVVLEHFPIFFVLVGKNRVPRGCRRRFNFVLLSKSRRQRSNFCTLVIYAARLGRAFHEVLVEPPEAAIQLRLRQGEQREQNVNSIILHI